MRDKKKIAIVFLLVIPLCFLVSGRPEAALSPRFKFVPPPPWKSIRMPGVDAGWTLPGEPSHPAITVTAEANDGFIDPKGLNDARLIPEIERIRSIPYRIFGISDWKIEKHRVSPYRGGQMLQIEGHYLSPSGTRVRFLERDYFLGLSSYTVIFSQDVGSQFQAPAKTDGQIQAWLDRFRAEDGSS